MKKNSKKIIVFLIMKKYELTGILELVGSLGMTVVVGS
jgi:hypothetical protein